jgi:excisionase family DNA binding protein
MPHDRYQTVPELADRLEVAEATVRQWIKAGVLRAIDIGKGWRIADTDLERFLKARETAPRERDTTAIGSAAEPETRAASAVCTAALPRHRASNQGTPRGQAKRAGA